MEGKFMLIISLFCAVAVMGKPAQENDGGSCDISGNNRWECGWLGIDEDTCLKRGCCWDNSDPNAKFCFVKKGAPLPDGLCPVAPSERKDCGHIGITKEQCLGKSCCWEELEEGSDTPWCFYQPEEKPMGCYIYHGVYGTCKYVCDPGDKKMYGMGECRGRICCYKGYPQ